MTTERSAMLAPQNDATSRPYAVIGAGDLVSHLQRSSNDAGTLNYRFNLFRMKQNAEVTHALRPEDLRHVVKVCQVMAFTIADDGWIPLAVRRELFALADELDVVTQRWSTSDHDE
jgi:hypothetical protein